MKDQISESFSITKDFLSCKCCNAFNYNDRFWRLMQQLRWVVDKPFYTDRKGGSGFRCSIYNKQIKGAKDSRHLHGDALDVSTHGWSGNERYYLVREAIHLGFSVGIYQSWVHLDLRPGLPVVFHG